MKSATRGAAGVLRPRIPAAKPPRWSLTRSATTRPVNHDDLASRIRALLNPPSSSTGTSKPDDSEMLAFVGPLVRAGDSEQAGTVLAHLERGISESGFSRADLPVPLLDALSTLREQAGRQTILTASDAENVADRATANGEPTDRVDMGRFHAKLKKCVNKGDSETLQAIWKEHKPRFTLSTTRDGESEWRNEMLAKILSACLRCERKVKSVTLRATIADITAHAPKPMPTGIFNVIIAHRADVEDPASVEAIEEEVEDGIRFETQGPSVGEGSRPTLKTLRVAWNMAGEQGVRKDLRSYMIYMEGLGRSGDIDGLRETWSALLADNDVKTNHTNSSAEPYPPVLSFNHMLSSALRIPKVGPPFALELFDRSVQSGTPLINIVTINTVLRHHARMADIQSMTSLFSLAAQRGLQPDAVTYTTLVQGLLRADRVEMAKNVLSKMLSEGLEPNERMCSLLVSDLARSGSQAGLQRAEEMMSEMRRKGMEVTPVTWTSLISGYFRGGWESDAWAAIDRMGRSGSKLNRVGYNMVLKQGQGAWCVKVFQKMIKDGVSPNGDTFFIVLNPLVHRKQWGDAGLVVQEMKRLGFRPDKGALRRLVSKVEARM